MFFDARPETWEKGAYMYPTVKWAVVRFHYGTHKDAYCREHCNPDDHPALDFVNTEACEQLFAWLSKYKYQAVNMSYAMYKNFAYHMVMLHNESILNGL